MPTLQIPKPILSILSKTRNAFRVLLALLAWNAVAGNHSFYVWQRAWTADVSEAVEAALVLGGSIMPGSDPKAADVFFKRLCKLRPHPVAEAANARNWFTEEMQEAVRNAPFQTLDEVVAMVRKMESRGKNDDG